MDFSKELSDFTHSMMCEPLKEASASAISMDTTGPMLFKLCEIFSNFLLWIMLTVLPALPDTHLKAIGDVNPLQGGAGGGLAAGLG